MARRQDWSPRGAHWPRGPLAKALADLARTHVGDGGSPNAFFVSLASRVVMVSFDFLPAYQTWKAWSVPLEEVTALEDRQNGLLASVEPDEETGRLRRMDLTNEFGFR